MEVGPSAEHRSRRRAILADVTRVWYVTAGDACDDDSNIFLSAAQWDCITEAPCGLLNTHISRRTVK